MKPKRFWSPSDDELLKQLYPHTPTKALAKRFGRALTQVYRHAIRLGLRKSAEYLAGPDACRLRRGDHIGAATQFRPGIVPHNKGVRRPGWSAGRMRETQFRKGQLSGATRRKWVPIGTVVVDGDGYSKRKIADDRTVPSRFNWVLEHVDVWTRANGPVPKGHAVVFRDGNRQNTAVENLECISRQELAHRNRMWGRLPEELARVIQLNGALKRKIRRLSNGEKQNVGSAGPSLRDARST